MKDDHMKNGQLKPGYNWQISTCDQYILNYDIYHNPTDTLTLPDHLDQFHNLYDNHPEVVVADAGYGSEENYEYLEKAQIQAYVKYNYFHKEQKQKGKIQAYVKYNYFHKEQKQKGKVNEKNPFHPEYLFYNKEQDFYVCPMGQRMEKLCQTTRKTTSGYKQQLSIYQAKNCMGCPLRGMCHKGKWDRKIQINHNLIRHKNKARDKLLSEQGILHRSQRPADVEAVFGNIKQNKKFTRFNLRGKEMVVVEAGLVALAHNLQKMAN
jgi:hypothetical protein